MPDNAYDSYEHDAYAGGSSGVGAKKIIAAGFLIVVLVVAAGLFIINRGGEDDQAQPVGGGDADVSAEQFQWADKKADPWGTMMYLPEDRRGQVPSTDTRQYPDPFGMQAANARAEGVVFQATEFSAGAPIPFSTTDGPTGFDGTVPIGYTQSAAGATLAASAYLTQSAHPPTYAEYFRKVTINPSTADIAKAEQRVEENRAAHEANDDITGAAMRFYQVDAFDGDYAKIRLYLVSAAGGPKSVAEFSYEYRWIDGMWKPSGKDTTRVLDAVPQEAESWEQ